MEILKAIVFSVAATFVGILFLPELQLLAEIMRNNLYETFIMLILCIVMVCVIKLTVQQG